MSKSGPGYSIVLIELKNRRRNIIAKRKIANRFLYGRTLTGTNTAHMSHETEVVCNDMDFRSPIFYTFSDTRALCI